MIENKFLLPIDNYYLFKLKKMNEKSLPIKKDKARYDISLCLFT